MTKTSLLTVHAVPNAKKTEVVGWDGQVLKIKVHAIAEKGKANQELIAFLAKYLKLSKSSLKLLRGETSRIKTLEIPLSKEDLVKIIEDQSS